MTQMLTALPTSATPRALWNAFSDGSSVRGGELSTSQPSRSTKVAASSPPAHSPRTRSPSPSRTAPSASTGDSTPSARTMSKSADLVAFKPSPKSPGASTVGGSIARLDAQHSVWYTSRMYHVRLTYAMIIALVDLATGYGGDDTPALDHRTLIPLARRELIRIGRSGYVLTAKGRAYLDMARYEYETAEALLKEQHREAA